MTKNLDLVDYADRLNLSTGKYLALVIGNQDYDNWTDLETPLNDVDKVSRVLESSYNFEVTKLENFKKRNSSSYIFFGEKVNLMTMY